MIKYGGRIIPSFDKDISTTCSASPGTGDSDESENDFRVFVPLCGKTVDMAFLAQQPSVSQVVGIDGIRKALVTFAEEHPQLMIQTDGDINKRDEGGDVVERLTGKGIELLRGDLFDVNEGVAGKFDMILDR